MAFEARVGLSLDLDLESAFFLARLSAFITLPELLLSALDLALSLVPPRFTGFTSSFAFRKA